ncbi:MAG: protein BatD [Elusimicrobia bacterium]|nr:protein BatD [Elusimicrobiota bacterium]
MTGATLLLALVLSPAGWAAEVLIQASVDKSVVTLNDQIVLEVSVSGPAASLPEPKFPAMPNFSVYSSGKNHSISFVNGKVSSTIVHTYVLVPRFLGKGEIGSISLTVDGNTVKTDPIAIEVQSPNAAAAPTPGPTAAPRPKGPSGGRAPGAPANAVDVFVMADVDKKKAFVNEQVTLSVKFFTGVPLAGNPQYDAPKMSGFLAEDLPPERHGEVSHRGRTYYYSEIKTALFPAQAGRLSIGPATVRAQVQRDVAIDPFAADFFQRFFSQGFAGVEDRVLKSDPVGVTGEPLPTDGKPPDFSGAVGQFAIAAAIDRANPKAGDAVNLTVTVQGTGNIKALGDVKIPDMPSFRVYDTVSSMNLDKKNDLVRGSKVFRTVVVPKVSGALSIPPITFSYFDPSKRQYVQASTLPIALKVSGGPAEQPQPTTAAAPTGKLAAVSEDIRYIKTAPGQGGLAALLENVGLADNAHSIPFLVFAVSLAMAMRREHLTSDPKGQRFRSALKRAHQRIREAEHLAGQAPQAAASLMSEALLNFLGDKLDAAASGLTQRRALELLKAKAPTLAPKSFDAVRDLWEQLDLMRFAPPAAGDSAKGSDAAARIKALIKELDREIKR